MKRILYLFLIGLIASSAVHAQTESKPFALGLHFGTKQYHGDLANEYWDFTNLHAAGGLSLSGYLTKSWDWQLLVSHGIIDHSKMWEGQEWAFRTSIIDLNAMLKYKIANGFLLNEDFFLKPYVVAGVGDAVFSGPQFGVDSVTVGFNFPVGFGFDLPINDKISFNYQTTNNYTLTDNLDQVNEQYQRVNATDKFMFHSVGLKFNFSCKSDMDKDGIADEDDACPDVAGVEMFKGCPDTDNDGVADADDKCPEVAGILANKGCPAVSEADATVMKRAMKGLFFETGSDKIKAESYPILDAVVKVMKVHKEYGLAIEGHTDNTGNADFNKQLSKKRAEAAKKYLIEKGIDGGRLTAEGFGPDKPIADNNTKEGRALNRRVEFKIVF